jgi:hypothetical protein
VSDRDDSEDPGDGDLGPVAGDGDLGPVAGDGAVIQLQRTSVALMEGLPLRVDAAAVSSGSWTAGACGRGTGSSPTPGM